MIGSRFAFATSPKGLHALPFVPRRLNERRIAGILSSSGGNAEETVFAGIQRLRTGHILSVSSGGVRTACFWHPDLKRTLALPREEDYWEAFADLFSRVVSEHMEGLTPAGLMLSGGLDSSVIAATACRRLGQSNSRLMGYTEVPRFGVDGILPYDRYADETPYVRALAVITRNLDVQRLSCSDCTIFDGLERTFSCLQQPFRNVSNRVWMEAILQTARADGHRVMLDGMQGNITISWNGAGLLPELVFGGHFAAAWRQARASSAALGQSSSWRLLVRHVLLPLLPDPVWLALDRLRRIDWRHGMASPLPDMSVIHPEFAASVGLTNALARQRLLMRSRGSARKSRYYGLVTQDSGAILSGYRARYGVDCRSPAADVRIAEFCLSLPEKICSWNGHSRTLVRRTFAGSLPAIITNNTRRGVQAADWLQRLWASRERVRAEFFTMEQCDTARRMIDIDRLRSTLIRLEKLDDPVSTGQVQEFAALQFGLMMGKFLAWFESGA